jgi:uncharacterized membrane protein (UPF0127 family)
MRITSTLATEHVSLACPDGCVVVESCLVAARPLRRMRGLLGRGSLPRGEGILLRPAASIHTFFMRFPIDVVFLDRELVVVGIDRDLRPWRASARKRAHSVLELAAGECERHGLLEGDVLVAT